MKKYRRWVVGTVLCVIGAGALPPVRHALLAWVGQTLVTDSPLGDAAVVVLLTEVGPAGELEVADLVVQRRVPRALIMAAPLPSILAGAYDRQRVTPLDVAPLKEQVLVRLGIDPGRIEILRVAQGGTTGESQALIQWCQARGVRSVIVVSSRHHSRRLARVLRRVIAGRPLTATVRPARYDAFEPRDWWQQRDTLRAGLVELQKLILDVAAHPMS